MREDNFFGAAKITKLVFFLALVTAPVLSAPASPCQAEALSGSLQSQDKPEDSKTPAAKPENPEASKTQLSTPSQPAQTRAWEMLVAGIRDGKASKRTAAIAALGALGPQPRAVRLIEEALDDKDFSVRQAAAIGLGEMKARESISKLRGALNDKSPEVSFAAARSLWQMGDRSGRDILVEVLDRERKTSEGSVKSNLRDTYKKYHSRSALALIGAKQAAGMLFGPLSLGITAAQELAKDKSAPVRALSASLLAWDPSDDAAHGLDDALQDKNWIVRAAAAEALGKLPRNGQIEELAPLLDDDKEVVRFMAASSIVRLSQFDRKPTIEAERHTKFAAR